MSEQNWDAVAIAPAIEAMATMMRRRWRVWLGVLDRHGDVTPLSAISEPVSRPLCACFKANPFPEQEDSRESLLSCRRTLREWAPPSPGTSASLRTCHAGFSAILAPITSQGKVIGQLYASGFADAHGEQLGDVRARLATLGLDTTSQVAAWSKEVPRLSAPERDMLRSQLQTLAALITQHLEHGASGPLVDSSSTSFCGMLGQSPPMRRLFDLIERVATTNSTVLILGENGTGKELVARAVHQISHRRDSPYVVQNCAAIPGELIESELFGHKRGAFSGAHRDREGLFSSADRGTFFLDEIGEMDIVLQAKMLRVVQEGTFLPVGDSSYRKVDVRLIFATNRDLREMVSRKAFREDLYFRVNVITLEVPPLRERPTDIPLLVEHFLLKSARRHGLGSKHISPACMKQLMSHDWPGNVRELENELERMAILSGTRELIDVDDLSPRLSGIDAAPNLSMLFDMTLPEAVDVLERQMILASLERHDFNKTRAAKELGVSRRNLIRKVAQYGFEPGGSAT